MTTILCVMCEKDLSRMNDCMCETCLYNEEHSRILEEMQQEAFEIAMEQNDIEDRYYGRTKMKDTYTEDGRRNWRPYEFGIDFMD